VCFQYGEIVHASYRGARGLETALTILQFSKGTFEFKNDVPSPTTSVNDSTIAILFEAHRLKDERHRDQK